jgi:hypothetical protein
MALSRQLVGAMASAAARRRRSYGGDVLTAVGKDFTAVLSSSMRGPLVTRRVPTLSDAYAMARRLLDDAERQQFNRGELVRVEVGQSDG